MRFCAAVSFVVLLASVVAAQDPAQKPPVEKEEPDFAFLGNSPYLEQKGQVQFINVLRFDTRRGRPNQKFSSAFNRMEFGLTDRWEFDAMTFWSGSNFLSRSDSLVGVRYQVLSES